MLCKIIAFNLFKLKLFRSKTVVARNLFTKNKVCEMVLPWFA